MSNTLNIAFLQRRWGYGPARSWWLYSLPSQVTIKGTRQKHDVQPPASPALTRLKSSPTSSDTVDCKLSNHLGAGLLLLSIKAWKENKNKRHLCSSELAQKVVRFGGTWSTKILCCGVDVLSCSNIKDFHTLQKKHFKCLIFHVKYFPPLQF